MSTEPIRALNRAWWEETPLPNRQADAETAALDAQAEELSEIPGWAIAVRGTMPRWGMEMCAHRWLDGLDELGRMLAAQEHWPLSAGHCGEVPGHVYAGAHRRVQAVERWAQGLPPVDDELAPLMTSLGAPTVEQCEAAAGFVELVRAAFVLPPDEGIWPDLEARWRPVAERNPIWARLLDGDGLIDALQNSCNYRTLARLDAFVALIGDPSVSPDLTGGTCNQALRRVFLDDPERYAVTRGYLWGWWAALAGKEPDWLSTHKPECLGAALYAYQQAQDAGVGAPLGRWLVGSLFKTTHVWVARALSLVGDRARPAWADDLPRLSSIRSGG